MAEASSGEGKRGGIGGLSVLGLILLSLLAIGSGAIFGHFVPGSFSQSSATQEADKPEVKTPASGAQLLALDPITTNLASPSTTWIRLEVSLVVEEDIEQDPDVLKRTIAEDLLGYLRTMSLDQIAGPSGFQHLREDLSDRVRIRSEGRISGIVITSLLLE